MYLPPRGAAAGRRRRGARVRAVRAAMTHSYSLLVPEVLDQYSVSVQLQNPDSENYVQVVNSAYEPRIHACIRLRPLLENSSFRSQDMLHENSDFSAFLWRRFMNAAYARGKSKKKDAIYCVNQQIQFNER